MTEMAMAACGGGDILRIFGPWQYAREVVEREIGAEVLPSLFIQDEGDLYRDLKTGQEAKASTGSFFRVVFRVGGVEIFALYHYPEDPEAWEPGTVLPDDPGLAIVMATLELKSL